MTKTQAINKIISLYEEIENQKEELTFEQIQEVKKKVSNILKENDIHYYYLKITKFPRHINDPFSEKGELIFDKEFYAYEPIENIVYKKYGFIHKDYQICDDGSKRRHINIFGDDIKDHVFFTKEEAYKELKKTIELVFHREFKKLNLLSEKFEQLKNY